MCVCLYACVCACVYVYVIIRSPIFSLQGLRVQDTKVISPWELLEGVRNSGPLMLSWFGAVRMKRKPLKYDEQRRTIRFHTHQNHLQSSMCQMHSVSLPDLTPLPAEEKSPVDTTTKPSADARPIKEEKPGEATLPQPPDTKQLSMIATMPPGQGVQQPRLPMGAPRPMPGQATAATFLSPMRPVPPGIMERAYPPGTQPGVYSAQAQRAAKLRQIQQQQLSASWQSQNSMGSQMGMGFAAPQSRPQTQQSYPMGAVQQGAMLQRHGMMGYNNPQYQARLRQLQMIQRMPLEQRLRYRQQLQLQHQQRAAMMANQQHQQMGQFNPQMQYRQMPHQGMRPMQANPPVPMQQVLQQSYPGGAPPPQQQMMVRPQQMQYQQQPQRMNPMHPPMF